MGRAFNHNPHLRTSKYQTCPSFFCKSEKTRVGGFNPLWKTSSSKYVKIWIHFPQKNARWTFLQKFSTLKPPGPSDAKKLSPTWISSPGTPRVPFYFLPLDRWVLGVSSWWKLTPHRLFSRQSRIWNSVCFVHLDINGGRNQTKHPNWGVLTLKLLNFTWRSGQNAGETRPIPI